MVKVTFCDLSMDSAYIHRIYTFMYCTACGVHRVRREESESPYKSTLPTKCFSQCIGIFVFSVVLLSLDKYKTSPPI